MGSNVSNFDKGFQPVTPSQKKLLEDNVAPERGGFGDYVQNSLGAVSNSLVNVAVAKYHELWSNKASQRMTGYVAQKIFPYGEYEATKEYSMAEAVLLQNTVLARRLRDTTFERQDRGILMDFSASIAADLVADPVNLLGYGLAGKALGMVATVAASGKFGLGASRVARAMEAASMSNPIAYGTLAEISENVSYSLAANTFKNEFLTSVTPPQDYTGTDFAMDVAIGAAVGAFSGAVIKRYKNIPKTTKDAVSPPRKPPGTDLELMEPGTYHYTETEAHFNNIAFDKSHDELPNLEMMKPGQYFNSRNANPTYNMYNPDYSRVYKLDLDYAPPVHDTRGIFYVNAQETSFTPFGRGIELTTSNTSGHLTNARAINAVIAKEDAKIEYSTELVAALHNSGATSEKAKEFVTFLSDNLEKATRDSDMSINKFLTDIQENLANLVDDGEIPRGDAESILDSLQEHLVRGGIDGVRRGDSVFLFEKSYTQKSDVYTEASGLEMDSDYKYESPVAEAPQNPDNFPVVQSAPPEMPEAAVNRFYKEGVYQEPKGTIAYDPILEKWVGTTPVGYRTEYYDTTIPVDYSMDIAENIIKRYDENITQFAQDIDAEFTLINDNIEMLLKNDGLADKYFKLTQALDDVGDLKAVLDDATIDVELSDKLLKRDWKDAVQEAKEALTGSTRVSKAKQKAFEKKVDAYARKYGKDLRDQMRARLDILERVDENATNIMKYERDVYQTIQEEIKDGKALLKNQEKALRALTICLFKGR